MDAPNLDVQSSLVGYGAARRQRKRPNTLPYADRRQAKRVHAEAAQTIKEPEGVFEKLKSYVVGSLSWILTAASQKEQDLLDEYSGSDEELPSAEGFQFKLPTSSKIGKENMETNSNDDTSGGKINIKSSILSQIENGKKFTDEEIQVYSQKLKERMEASAQESGAENQDSLAGRKRPGSPSSSTANKRHMTQHVSVNGSSSTKAPVARSSFLDVPRTPASGVISVGATPRTQNHDASRMLQSLDRLSTPLDRSRKLYAPSPTPSPYVPPSHSFSARRTINRVRSTPSAVSTLSWSSTPTPVREPLKTPVNMSTSLNGHALQPHYVPQTPAGVYSGNRMLMPPHTPVAMHHMPVPAFYTPAFFPPQPLAPVVEIPASSASDKKKERKSKRKKERKRDKKEKKRGKERRSKKKSRQNNSGSDEEGQTNQSRSPPKAKIATSDSHQDDNLTFGTLPITPVTFDSKSSAARSLAKPASLPPTASSGAVTTTRDKSESSSSTATISLGGKNSSFNTGTSNFRVSSDNSKASAGSWLSSPPSTVTESGVLSAAKKIPSPQPSSSAVLKVNQDSFTLDSAATKSSPIPTSLSSFSTSGEKGNKRKKQFGEEDESPNPMFSFGTSSTEKSSTGVSSASSFSSSTSTSTSTSTSSTLSTPSSSSTSSTSQSSAISSSSSSKPFSFGAPQTASTSAATFAANSAANSSPAAPLNAFAAAAQKTAKAKADGTFKEEVKKDNNCSVCGNDLDDMDHTDCKDEPEEKLTSSSTFSQPTLTFSFPTSSSTTSTTASAASFSTAKTDTASTEKAAPAFSFPSATSSSSASSSSFQAPSFSFSTSSSAFKAPQFSFGSKTDTASTETAVVPAFSFTSSSSTSSSSEPSAFSLAASKSSEPSAFSLAAPKNDGSSTPFSFGSNTNPANSSALSTNSAFPTPSQNSATSTGPSTSTPFGNFSSSASNPATFNFGGGADGNFSTFGVSGGSFGPSSGGGSSMNAMGGNSGGAFGGGGGNFGAPFGSGSFGSAPSFGGSNNSQFQSSFEFSGGNNSSGFAQGSTASKANRPKVKAKRRMMRSNN